MLMYPELKWLMTAADEVQMSCKGTLYSVIDMVGGDTNGSWSTMLTMGDGTSDVIPAVPNDLLTWAVTCPCWFNVTSLCF